MSDIFISYSRKDSEHALSLAGRLRAEGIEVWIDQRGITGAEQWAAEIVEGIEDCSTFLLLLSPESTASDHVLKELALALEKRKRILPVDIHATELPSSFQYPLAGIQRVALSDFEAILHAHRHGVTKQIKKDERKSLMILPFDDLSPAHDNEWFSDGIVSELINALSNVRSLRLADAQATKEFKHYQGQLSVYAKEMNIRYFVQGDVRKFGDQIKISARLLDSESGDHLWQDSFRGTMDNIFDFQEEVAKKVLAALKVHVTETEKKKLGERGTENAEAYELYLKAEEYFNRQTKQGFEHAIHLLTDTIAIDPNYAEAYSKKANVLGALFRGYERNAALLTEGLELVEQALRIKPELWSAYFPYTMILMLQGKIDEAETEALRYRKHDAGDAMSHFTLGYLYQNQGWYDKANAAYEEGMKIYPDRLPTLFNYVASLYNGGEDEKAKEWASVAIPKFEKQIKLFPDDQWQKVNYAMLLFFNGRKEEARATANALEIELRDGRPLYNTAALKCMLGDFSGAMETFKKAIEHGFRNINIIYKFLVDEKIGVGSMKDTPEWNEMMKRARQLELEASNG